jgi:PAS domain S-box-containing protein
MANPQRRAMGVGRELHGRRKDGTLVPVEVGLTPVTTSDGTFVLSSIVDVTERRKAEARTLAILESIPCGMLMIDSCGQIVLVNQEVERLFGYQREELLGASVDVLVPERFRHDHPEFRASYINKPSARPMGGGRELFGRRKDGSEFPIEIGLNPFDTSDGLYVLSSVVDISARKDAERERQSLEAQLRQAQKMEALGTLAGGVAHDFNNLLSTLIGYAEFLGERLSDDPGGTEDVEQLKLAAERGRQLVARILLFSRKQKEQLQPTDL